MMQPTAPPYGKEFAAAFAYNKRLAEQAAAQLNDEQLHAALDEQSNSVAVVMKHVAGNLRSRWTDFLSSDGEKPWRDRDAEFVDSFADRQELMDCWEAGWSAVFASLDSLKNSDFDKLITIRGEKLSVPLAIGRSLSHTGYHVGQIVMISRTLAGDAWQTLTIARGQSQQHNTRTWGEQQYRGEQR